MYTIIFFFVEYRVAVQKLFARIPPEKDENFKRKRIQEYRNETMFNGEHVKAKPPDLNPRNIWDVFWLLCVVLRLVEKKNNGPMDAYCTVIALSQRRLTFDAGTVELDANFSRISTSFPHRRNYFLFPLFHSIDKLLGFPAT